MHSTPTSTPVSRRAARALATIIAAVLLLAGSAQAAPRPEPEDTWMANGNVYAVARVGGRVYLAGDFTALTDGAGHSVPACGSRHSTRSPGRRWTASRHAPTTSSGRSPCHPTGPASTSVDSSTRSTERPMRASRR